MTKPEEAAAELLPCPFCKDPMEMVDGVFRHVHQTAHCPIRQNAWHEGHLPAWNTRPLAIHASADNIDAATTELPPCKCGASASVSHSHGIAINKWEVECSYWLEFGDGDHCYGEGDTEAEAIAAWNTRPSPDHAGLVEAIIDAYHTTRMSETGAVEHILSKSKVRQMIAALSHPSPSMPDREEVAKAIASVAGATWPQDANRYRAMADAAIAAQGVPLDRETPNEWDMIEKLRAEEGWIVEIPFDNPDFGGPNASISWSCDYGVTAEQFTGESIKDCLQQALAKIEQAGGE